MSTPAQGFSDNTLKIYLTIRQYPILRGRIRERMRQELFSRGIITPEALEADVREKAVQSQRREGLSDPFGEESYEVWEKRIARVRDAQVDFYFAYNLLYTDLERIIKEILAERGSEPDLITFNPELAPQEMLFEQAGSITRMPPAERRKVEARLQEIKVVLIRTMISDQLAYLNIARKWFKVEDLEEIRRRKIGYGKIGGKAAGMMLAYRILQDVAPQEVRGCLRIPESYFIASDLFYTFMATNGLVHWSDQKYKPETEMRRDYPQIVTDFVRGSFPADILKRLGGLLAEIGRRPLIVRSSSLLEDNFGTSFAGKYDSFFCPNQGTPKENLAALTEAIARVYASCLNPNALLYRHHKGLVDYDERIAILLQCVEGEAFGGYFLPHGAGVAFSHNLYRWSPQIVKEDGFMRLVWGLGTRAVEAVGNDHPRMVALSHPLLHPADSPKSIRQQSQHFVDLIDLQENTFKTLPAEEVLTAHHPAARYIAQVDEDGYLSPMRTNMVAPERLVITFDDLLRRTTFARRMKSLLQILKDQYGAPVDVEFTLQVVDPGSLQPEVFISLLQCRPQSHFEEERQVALPTRIPAADILFATRRMVPRGHVEGIRWVLYVQPEGYFQLDPQGRQRLEHAIGALNHALREERFICVGPGRWGTSTPNLGVSIAYGDIYHTLALVELTGKGVAPDLEPSFGTHFFQDLMEAHIFPLAITLGESGSVFNRPFFEGSPNHLTDHISEADEDLLASLRLLRVEDFRPGHVLHLIMNDEAGKAVAFLKPVQ